MNIPYADLFAQYRSIQPEIDRALEDVIYHSDYIKGKHVAAFENEFALKNGVRNCIGVANGTDAIFIALKMLGIASGDEVITTALSWISTSEAITLTGAKPVFVDIEEDFFTIDPKKIEDKITARTKALLPVHLYGQCADMEPIIEIAKKYELKVIEDTAQAHFSQYKGNLAGTMGDVATFSFYPGKNLGAYGDAGAIVTNNDQLAEKMRMFANHGALKKHFHQIEGINSRLDGLQAAVLNVKLRHIDSWTKKRREKASFYNQLLSGLSEIEIPHERDGSRHVYHIYCIQTEKRNALKEYLEKKGINTAIHYPNALPNLPAYSYMKLKKMDFPVASKIQERILSLPIYPEMTNEQIEIIVSNIFSFWGKRVVN